MLDEWQMHTQCTNTDDPKPVIPRTIGKFLKKEKATKFFLKVKCIQNGKTYKRQKMTNKKKIGNYKTFPLLHLRLGVSLDIRAMFTTIGQY